MSTIGLCEIVFDGRSPDETIALVGKPNGYAETLLHAQARNCAVRANQYFDNMRSSPIGSHTRNYWRHNAELAVMELRTYVYSILVYREKA